MYRVISEADECGRYLVEFSIPWPPNARTLHIIMEYTSWSGGLLPLTKVGSRGVIRLKLWAGEYPYAFIVNMNNVMLDPENSNIIRNIKVKYLSKVIDASLARVKGSLNNDVLIETYEIEPGVTYVGLKVPSGKTFEEICEKIHEGPYTTHYGCILNSKQHNYSFKEVSTRTCYINSNVNSNTVRQLAGEPVLKVTLDELLDRELRVLGMMRYLGIRTLYVAMPSPTLIRPEELLYMGYDIEVAELIRSLINRHINILLELPISYVSPCFQEFVDFIERGAKSKFKDWFIPLSNMLNRGLSSVPQPPILRNSCYMIYEVIKELVSLDTIVFEDRDSLLIRLNMDSPNVMSLIDNTVRYWVKVGVKGIVIKRCYSVPVNVIDAVSITVKEVNPQTITLGESLGNPVYIATNTLLDGISDYYIGTHALSLITGVMNPETFISNVLHVYTKTPFIKSLLSMPSIPYDISCSVLSNKELLLYSLIVAILPGFTPIKFNDITNCTKDLRKYVRQLIKILKSYKSLRYGLMTMKALANDSGILVRRVFNDEEILALINLSNNKIYADLREVYGSKGVNRKFIDLINGDGVKGEVEIKPKSGTLILATSPYKRFNYIY